MNSKQLFTKNLRAKEGEKIKPFMLSLIQGYFVWSLSFFWRNFFDFLKSFALGIKFSLFRNPVLIFFKTFFLGPSSTFWKRWSQIRKKQYWDFFLHNCEFYFASIVQCISLIFLQGDVITVPYSAISMYAKINIFMRHAINKDHCQIISWIAKERLKYVVCNL